MTYGGLIQIIEKMPRESLDAEVMITVRGKYEPIDAVMQDPDNPKYVVLLPRDFCQKNAITPTT